MPKSKNRKNHAEKAAKRAANFRLQKELYQKALTKLVRENAERIQVQAATEHSDNTEI